MKKQVLTVYVCEHCGKISRSAGALTLHERWCKKNPAMRPLCYNCKNYYEAEPDDTQPITITRSMQNPFFGEIISTKEISTKVFRKNKCTCLSVYLFNGCRMYEDTKQALMGKDLWHQMPTEATGCEHFKKGTPQQPAVPFDNPVNVSIPEPLQKQFKQAIEDTAYDIGNPDLPF